MISIIVTSDPRYPVNKLAIQTAVFSVLQKHRITGNIEIGISIIGDRKMHAFNKKYRGIDSSTNILSFAYEDPISTNQLQHIPKRGWFIKSPDKVLRLGDILISWPVAREEASQEGITIDEYLHFLLEHGTKHLLGVHHD